MVIERDHPSWAEVDAVQQEHIDGPHVTPITLESASRRIVA
jgi:hypothetical protein